MDELKLKLSTKLMRGIIGKLISRTLYKKYGYKMDIRINEIEVEMVDEKVRLHINVDTEVNKNDLASVLDSIGLD